MKSVSERCIELIAKEKKLPLDQIGFEKNLEELQFDSMDMVTLVFDIEEEFQISVSDDELLNLRTVGDIVAGVERKVSTLKATA